MGLGEEGGDEDMLIFGDMRDWSRGSAGAGCSKLRSKIHLSRSEIDLSASLAP